MVEIVKHPQFENAVAALVRCFREGRQLLLCGNGGSAADCAHIAGELVKGFQKKRPLTDAQLAAIGEPWARTLQCGLPAIDLTAQGALIAAVCNDLDSADAYAQQVLAYGKLGDVLMGISTSGNAENVYRAMRVARALGMTTIALTGEGGGRLGSVCDMLLNVPETETYKVQERHIILYHQLCIRVEEAFFTA